MLNSNVSPTCPHNMVNFSHKRLRSVGEFVALQQISTGFSSDRVTARHYSCGRRPNFAALNRGKGKGKGFPYSTPSVGPGADPGVQAVSLQVTVSHPPGGRLPLLSSRPAVTSPAAEHHRPLAGTKLYCLVTEAHRCKQLA